jgi:hypothetical protein
MVDLWLIRHIWYATQDERAALGCPSPALSVTSGRRKGRGGMRLDPASINAYASDAEDDIVNCFLTSESIGGAVKRT